MARCALHSFRANTALTQHLLSSAIVPTPQDAPAGKQGLAKRAERTWFARGTRASHAAARCHRTRTTLPLHTPPPTSPPPPPTTTRVSRQGIQGEDGRARATDGFACVPRHFTSTAPAPTLFAHERRSRHAPSLPRWKRTWTAVDRFWAVACRRPEPRYPHTTPFTARHYHTALRSTCLPATPAFTTPPLPACCFATSRCLPTCHRRRTAHLAPGTLYHLPAYTPAPRTLHAHLHRCLPLCHLGRQDRQGQRTHTASRTYLNQHLSARTLRSSHCTPQNMLQAALPLFTGAHYLQRTHHCAHRACAHRTCWPPNCLHLVHTLLFYARCHHAHTPPACVACTARCHWTFTRTPRCCGAHLIIRCRRYRVLPPHLLYRTTLRGLHAPRTRTSRAARRFRLLR